MINMNETKYMNLATGSVDTYDGWWYEDEDGVEVNAVDLGEVEEVQEDDDGENDAEVVLNGNG